eukprot:scaffold4274_cov175-Amphora_coffeaeformis.AAC.4
MHRGMPIPPTCFVFPSPSLLWWTAEYASGGCCLLQTVPYPTNQGRTKVSTRRPCGKHASVVWGNGMVVNNTTESFAVFATRGGKNLPNGIAMDQQEIDVPTCEPRKGDISLTCC